MTTPVTQIYGALDNAFQHFNTELFAQELPLAVITLQRRDARTMGYFSAARFQSRQNNSTTTDEIALNPQYFGRPLQDTLSTLVHEMCHLWQEHFDHASRSGYHNKLWAAKMRQIGLQPSHTGKPGGKDVGQRMLHYIVAGGPFEASCRRLMDGGFDVVWAEALKEVTTTAGDPPEDEEEKGRVRWICPNCKQKAWAKPTATLGCWTCQNAFVRG